jgi:hypothetical protein
MKERLLFRESVRDCSGYPTAEALCVGFVARSNSGKPDPFPAKNL